MKPSAAILIAYLGEITDLGRLALKTLGRNRVGLDILLVTDAPDPEIAGIRHLPFPEQFDARNRTGVSYEALRRHPRKLADLKPFLNLLFPQALAGYDRWGFADIDAIFSDRFQPATPQTVGDLPEINGGLGHFMIGDQTAFEAFQAVFFEYTASAPQPDLFNPARHFALDEFYFLHVVLNELQASGMIAWNRNYPRAVGDIRPFFFEPTIGLQRYSLFGSDSGQVWGRSTGGERIAFDYVHFQKRRVAVDAALIADDDARDFFAVQQQDGGFRITGDEVAASTPPTALKAARYRLEMQKLRIQHRFKNHGLRSRPAFDHGRVRQIVETL